jgi:hypothetical protein
MCTELPSFIGRLDQSRCEVLICGSGCLDLYFGMNFSLALYSDILRSDEYSNKASFQSTASPHSIPSLPKEVTHYHCGDQEKARYTWTNSENGHEDSSSDWWGWFGGWKPFIRIVLRIVKQRSIEVWDWGVLVLVDILVSIANIKCYQWNSIWFWIFSSYILYIGIRI